MQRVKFEGSAAELAAALASAISGEVRFDDGSRALYGADASNYRQIPIGVVLPRSVEDIVETVRICREFGAPILPRGGGTSQCGQCVNVAVVIDTSKYLNRVLEIDEASEVAPRRAGRRVRRAAQRCRAIPSHLRARSRDAQPLHVGRHDRQQLLRRAFGDGRQDGRERRGARSSHL